MTRFSPSACLLSALVAAVLGVNVAAQPSRGEAGRSRSNVDRIFSEWDRRDSPGCALALYQDGRIVYERGYGMASLEHDLPITPDSVFYVGSLSKQFTAMAAALAIQQKRLSADDPIRRFLPELPGYAASITVRHLIHHTSGLRDYNTLLSIAGRRSDEAFDNPTVLRITARQNGLNFQPGGEYLYSNTGYTLLAVIVERAAATPFAEFAAKHIFEPLGMPATHFHTDEGRLVKGRAFAYTWRGTSLALDTPSNERAGAGGVFATVRDLLHWDENFYTGRVGGRALIEQLETPGRLHDGTPLGYAWGLQLGSYRGLKIVEHGGALGGYRAHLLRFPDQHFSVAALCNLATTVPGNLTRQVADVALGARFREPKPAARPGVGTRAGRGVRSTEIPAIAGDASIADYAGTYHSAEAAATFTVAVTNGRLTLRRERDQEPAVLQASGADEFRFRGMTIRFARDASRRVQALFVDAGRVRDIRFERR